MSLIHISRAGKPWKYGVVFPIHSQAVYRHGRAAPVGNSQKRRSGTISWNEGRRKRKTRPGGQPDGSSYMGAWGGWALAPNTASMGRDDRSHIYWSPQGRRTFKRPAIFLTFWQGFSGGRLLRGGSTGFANRRSLRGHGRRWLVQG